NAYTARGVYGPKGSPTATGTPTQTATATPTCGPVWRVVNGPDLGPNANFLGAVAALSPNDAWAVGYDSNGTTYGAVREHWDGIQWAITNSPNVESYTDGLSAVAAISSNDVWAVGHYNAVGGSPYGTLIEHWNGTNWSIISSPSPGTDSGLYGVVALADDAW